MRLKLNDANGNAITRNGNTVSWYSYNYPATIANSASNETYQVYYGQNRQRWKSIYTDGSTVETTYNAGKLLEKVASSTGSTEYRHHIYAGSELVGI